MCFTAPSRGLLAERLVAEAIGSLYSLAIVNVPSTRGGLVIFSNRRNLARKVTMPSFTVAFSHTRTYRLPVMVLRRNKVEKANGGLLTRFVRCPSWIYLGVRRSVYRLVGFAHG